MPVYMYMAVYILNVRLSLIYVGVPPSVLVCMYACECVRLSDRLSDYNNIKKAEAIASTVI